MSRARPVEAEAFRGHIVSALGSRSRIATDAEGWPLCPGKYGRLEWRGAEPDGCHRIYAYCDASRVIAKLRAVPGITPRQTGDSEAAFSMGAGDVRAIRAAAALLRLRVRRSPDTARALLSGGVQSQFRPAGPAPTVADVPQAGVAGRG